MHGNVQEWVLDQYQPDFYQKLAGKGTAKDPMSPPTEIYGRVVRGGSWDDNPSILRSAARTFSTKEWKKRDPQFPQSIWYLTDAMGVGFRVVRPLRVPDAQEIKKLNLEPLPIDLEKK